MSELFSHATPTSATESGPLEPLSVDVTVGVGQREAFDGFTDNMHLWWPLSEFSTFGLKSHVGFEDGVLLEESPDGEQGLWATVQRWFPPSSLELSWHQGGNPLHPTRVRVGFDALTDSATAIHLTQDNWPSGVEGRKARERYRDWAGILGGYVRFMGGLADLD